MEDNYDDGPGTQQAPAEASEPAEAPGKTCLLPKSSFPNAKPGDSLSVQVVAVHGEEIEVTADNDDQDGGDPSGSDESQEAAPAPGGMDAMMQ